jgi:hypothetical protein
MFRFTIRDVLWLTVVAALAVGWWVEHRRAAAREAAWITCFHSALEKLSFHVQQEPETFDTPSGLWRIHCTTAVEVPNDGQ